MPETSHTWVCRRPRHSKPQPVRRCGRCRLSWNVSEKRKAGDNSAPSLNRTQSSETSNTVAHPAFLGELEKTELCAHQDVTPCLFGNERFLIEDRSIHPVVSQNCLCTVGIGFNGYRKKASLLYFQIMVHGRAVFFSESGSVLVRSRAAGILPGPCFWVF